MRINISKASGLVLASAVMLASVPMNAAHAASSEESRYVHPACEDTSKAICGVIVYAVAGAYTVDWVKLSAKGSQPDSTDTHPSCVGVEKKFDRNTPAGNYDTFVVPASCAYAIDIKILSGNKKDRNVFLTPGCQIIAKTDGTVTSNSWKSLELSTLSEQVPTSGSTPIDRSGHKCGKLSNSGT